MRAHSQPICARLQTSCQAASCGHKHPPAECSSNLHLLLWAPSGDPATPTALLLQVVALLLVYVPCAQASTVDELSATAGSSVAVSSDVGTQSSADCHGWEVGKPCTYCYLSALRAVSLNICNSFTVGTCHTLLPLLQTSKYA
jgi:hypothetical protein